MSYENTFLVTPNLAVDSYSINRNAWKEDCYRKLGSTCSRCEPPWTVGTSESQKKTSHRYPTTVETGVDGEREREREGARADRRRVGGTSTCWRDASPAVIWPWAAHKEDTPINLSHLTIDLIPRNKTLHFTLDTVPSPRWRSGRFNPDNSLNWPKAVISTI